MAGTLTTEDLVVAPPEVCGPGRPVVELVPVGGQDKPEERARRRVSRELEHLAWADGLGGTLVVSCGQRLLGTALVFLSLPRQRCLSSQDASPQEGGSGLGPAPLPRHQGQGTRRLLWPMDPFPEDAVKPPAALRASQGCSLLHSGASLGGGS